MGVLAPKVVPRRKFTAEEDKTWKALYERQAENRARLAVPEFARGLELLQMSSDRVPDIEEVNARLKRLTGWEGVPVEGLESGEAFYPMMANRQYPIGWFIRDPKDLSYTPAPDVFHDLYGHMPFFADPVYADFCAEFGRRASRYVGQIDILEDFERLFWFTIEFGLIETPAGRRIFGGGLLSSYTESLYSLSDKPTVLPFDIERIRRQTYRTDVFQQTLFLLPSREALFTCLDQYEAPYR